MSKYSGLFYGHHSTTELTFKKAILLYDEINFLDRASFNISGKFGTVGHKSPFRNPIKELEDYNYHIYCHEPIQGPIITALKDSISEDLNDENFTNSFINDFLNDNYFKYLFIQPGAKYVISPGEIKEKTVLGHEIIEAINKINWSGVIFDLEKLAKSEGLRFFNPYSNESLELTMAFFMTEASHLINSFLIKMNEINAAPFTEIPTYHKLLQAKYIRAQSSENINLPQNTKISYIANTIFDELIMEENLKNRSISDLLKFKKRHKEELRNFNDYLLNLQQILENEVYSEKFEVELQKLLHLEVLPRANNYKEELKRSWEDLFGSIISRIDTKNILLGLSVLVLKGASLEALATAGAIGTISSWLTPPVSDFMIKRRRIKRNNSLAYLLNL